MDAAGLFPGWNFRWSHEASCRSASTAPASRAAFVVLWTGAQRRPEFCRRPAGVDRPATRPALRISAKSSRLRRSKRAPGFGGAIGAHPESARRIDRQRPSCCLRRLITAELLSKERPLVSFQANQYFPVAYQLIIQKEPVFVRTRIDANPRRPALEPRSFRRLKHVRAERAALRIELDPQISRQRLPDHLIVRVQYHNIRENSHQNRFIGHFVSGSNLFDRVDDMAR